MLTGDIPSELGDLKALRDNLDLSSNRLSGPMPSELGKLVDLGRCICVVKVDPIMCDFDS